MKFYMVTYKGLYIGGAAVVIADSEKHAIDVVRNHNQTVNFNDVDVTEIYPDNGVLYNDNGNY